MMPAPTGRTTNNSLPYPLETDGADPSRDIQALAEKLDELININALVPIGGEAEWAGENDPSTSWMVENGRAISRTTYKKLFEAIGSKYGAGDGVNTFNIPNTIGRVSVGAGGGMPGLTLKELAKTYGTETVSLTTTQMPKHTHTLPTSAFAIADIGEGLAANVWQAGSGETVAEMGKTSPTGGITGEQSGTSEAHSNIQPCIAKNKIIRVL